MKLRLADTVFSRWIKKRDNYTCQRCGAKHNEKSQGLHCCHFISRRNEATRFDPFNTCAICYGCHSWFHQNPKEHELFMLGWLGKEEFDLLQIRRRKIVKKDDKAIIDKYKEV
jgi:hypothetical protein